MTQHESEHQTSSSLSDSDQDSFKEKTPKKPGWERRRFLVNPKVQIGYALGVAGIILICIGITAIVVYHSITSAVLQPSSAKINMDVALELAHAELFWKLLITASVLVSLGGLITICVLHRLVGPILRIENTLKSVAAGFIPSNIELRKKDEFKSLAKALLQTIESYETSTPIALVDTESESNSEEVS